MLLLNTSFQVSQMKYNHETNLFVVGWLLHLYAHAFWLALVLIDAHIAIIYIYIFFLII